MSLEAMPMIVKWNFQFAQAVCAQRHVPLQNLQHEQKIDCSSTTIQYATACAKYELHCYNCDTSDVLPKIRNGTNFSCRILYFASCLNFGYIYLGLLVQFWKIKSICSCRQGCLYKLMLLHHFLPGMDCSSDFLQKCWGLTLCSFWLAKVL